MGNSCFKPGSGQTHRRRGKNYDVKSNNTGSSSANRNPRITRNDKTDSKISSKRKKPSGTHFYDGENVDQHTNMEPSSVPQRTTKTNTNQVIDTQPRSANTKSDNNPHRPAPEIPFSNTLPGQASCLSKEKHPNDSSALDAEMSSLPEQNLNFSSPESVNSQQRASNKEDNENQGESMEWESCPPTSLIGLGPIFPLFDDEIPKPHNCTDSLTQKIPLQQQPPQESEEERTDYNPTAEAPLHKQGSTPTSQDCDFPLLLNGQMVPIVQENMAPHNENANQRLENEDDTRKPSKSEKDTSDVNPNDKFLPKYKKSRSRKERRQGKESDQHYSESHQIPCQNSCEMKNNQNTECAIDMSRLIEEPAEQDNKTVPKMEKDEPLQNFDMQQSHNLNEEPTNRNQNTEIKTDSTKLSEGKKHDHHDHTVETTNDEPLMQHGPDVVPKSIDLIDLTKNQEEESRRESKPIIETKKDEPLQILDVHQYFRDDFDLNSLDNLSFPERIHQIHTYAETFDTKVKEFEEEKYSLEYFVLDEKLMRLIEKLDKIKCQDDAELTKEKVQVISYIKQLHATLDERAKEET